MADLVVPALGESITEAVVSRWLKNIGDAVAQLKIGDKVCSYGFDLGPKQQEQIRSGALDGALGQQPFLQGFWPVMQLYLQIDRGISAANLDTRAQLVTKDDVDKVGKRFEN